VAAKSGGIIPPDFALPFVAHKGNKQWIWLALDVRSREIVGVYIGERSREGAQGLWAPLPGVYRQCAVLDPIMPCPFMYLAPLCAALGNQGQLPPRSMLERHQGGDRVP